MLEDEGLALGDSLVPCFERGMCVIRMARPRPAITLIFVEALTRERSPAGLFTYHAATGVIGPQNTARRLDSRAEAAVAGAQRLLNAQLVRHVFDQRHTANYGVSGIILQ